MCNIKGIPLACGYVLCHYRIYLAFIGAGALWASGLLWQLMRFYEVYCLSIAGIVVNGKKNALLRCNGIVYLWFYMEI